MDDSGFPRTPDRPIKLLETRVRYQRFVETTIGACGPDFLGGSATIFVSSSCSFQIHQMVHVKNVGCGPSDEDPRHPPCLPVDPKGKATKKMEIRKRKYLEQP